MTRRGRHVQQGLVSSSIANGLPSPESQLHTHTEGAWQATTTTTTTKTDDTMTTRTKTTTLPLLQNGRTTSPAAINQYKPRFGRRARRSRCVGDVAGDDEVGPAAPPRARADAGVRRRLRPSWLDGGSNRPSRIQIVL